MPAGVMLRLFRGRGEVPKSKLGRNSVRLTSLAPASFAPASATAGPELHHTMQSIRTVPTVRIDSVRARSLHPSGPHHTMQSIRTVPTVRILHLARYAGALGGASRYEKPGEVWSPGLFVI